MLREDFRSDGPRNRRGESGRDCCLGGRRNDRRAQAPGVGLALPVQVDLRARKAEGAPEVIASVLLAAGASRRMGTPKALLDYRGETFLDRLIRVTGAVCDPVIVVLGHHAQEIRGRVKSAAHFVVNPDPERGQLSSLQTALA